MRRPMVHRFSSVFTTDLGHKVRVAMQDAPDISQEADFQPRRIAVVEGGAPAQAGTILYGQSGIYLLMNQTSLTNVRRFRAISVTDELPWVRQGSTTDLVTKMKTSGAPEILNPRLAVVIEPLRSIKEMGFEQNKMGIYTGADVRTGDKIGPYQVHLVTSQLGIKLLEVF